MQPIQSKRYYQDYNYFGRMPGHDFVLVFLSRAIPVTSVKDLGRMERADFVGMLKTAPGLSGWHGYTVDESGRAHGLADRCPDAETAAQALRQLHFQTRVEYQAEQERLKDPAYALEKALKAHDWYSSYSDDFRVYSAGEASLDVIRDLLKKVDEETANRLWDQYAPATVSRPAPR